MVSASRGSIRPATSCGSRSKPLRHDRPTVVANFGETVDGVVALDRRGRTGGGKVSGFSPTDRFVMGILRALADAVLVGASTIRSSQRAAWTPEAISPAAAPSFADPRERLGLATTPTTLTATATGDLDPGHPVFADRGLPVVVAGPAAAVARLRRLPFQPHVVIEALAYDAPRGSATSWSSPAASGRGSSCRRGGPHLLGDLMGADRLDELFLTLAPQLAGRSRPDDRLALVEGVALWPARPT